MWPTGRLRFCVFAHRPSGVGRAISAHAVHPAMHHVRTTGDLGRCAVLGVHWAPLEAGYKVVWSPKAFLGAGLVGWLSEAIDGRVARVGQSHSEVLVVPTFAPWAK